VWPNNLVVLVDLHHMFVFLHFNLWLGMGWWPPPPYADGAGPVLDRRACMESRFLLGTKRPDSITWTLYI
jgi:hypothetical protein